MFRKVFSDQGQFKIKKKLEMPLNGQNYQNNPRPQNSRNYPEFSI